MHYPALRSVFEDFVPKNASPERRMHGAGQFVRKFVDELGLSVNEMGRPVIKEAQFSPREFSLRGLAESLCGYEWAENLMHSQASAYQVFEAGGPSVSPGDLPNVSAYLGSVSGLLDAALLEDYDKPDYIIDDLVQVVPSKTRQKKMIGLGMLGDDAEVRNPGDPHKFAQFTERYTTTSETQNQALALGVTMEAVYFDQTGDVLDRANAIGDRLGLRKEKDGMKMIAGVNNPYNYGGVSYNTYGTSGNWINKLTGNPLTDWEDVNAVNDLFSRMTDQETGNRISVSWDTMLVSPNKVLTAQYIQGATEVEGRTKSSQVVTKGPRRGTSYNVQSSVYLDQILTDAIADGGLGLTQAQANAYWWAIKTGGNKSAFIRVENWPFSVQRAAPNDFTMLNQKLMLAVFVDQQHSFDVREPRFVVQSTN